MIATLALAAPAEASDIGATRRFGLGIVLGIPTGLSMKYYLSQATAIDAALAYSTWGHGGFYLHGTWLIHPQVLFDDGSVEIPWYVGVGGVLGRWNERPDRYDSDTYVGVRIPIGVDGNLSTVPIQVFAEASLHVRLVPATGLGAGVAIGARYYF